MSYFYKNWNNKYQYPVYIHTFGKILDIGLKKKINNNISKNIFFIEINPKIPKQIKTNELYFNHTVNEYRADKLRAIQRAMNAEKKINELEKEILKLKNKIKVYGG